jgi:hypothetical protein
MSEIDWGRVPQPQAANVMRERQQEVAVKGAYLTKDYYGPPIDDYEMAAKKWLQANNGTEGPEVMQSLGSLLRDASRPSPSGESVSEGLTAQKMREDVGVKAAFEAWAKNPNFERSVRAGIRASILDQSSSVETKP